MSGRTTPLAEQPDWHPVHRANAMLHAALLSTHHAEPFEDRNSFEHLSRAIASVMDGPVSITYPTPLAARLDALDAVADSYPAFDGLMGGTRSPLADFDEFGEEPEAPAEFALEEDAEPDWDDGTEDSSFDDEVMTAGVPLDPEKWIAAPQVHVQTLMSEFRRRQRQASLLVAGSIATAALLTVGGLVLVASLTAPRPADADQPPAAHSTSIAWQRPAVSQQPLQIAAIATNRAAKSEPLLVPGVVAALPDSLNTAISSPQTILAASGREIAFGALLPPSHARYLLIRGLPAEATLSAGRDSGSGSWLVKGDHVPDLTLSLGRTAAGDYPLEVYALEAGDGPQGRRNFVLRVEPPAQAYAAADTAWASALASVVPSAHAAEQPAAPADSAVLRDRANQLLDIGDIAAARLLLSHLAERGDGEAAYQLARTFDRDVLARLGTRGMADDPAQARGWYQRASQDGNAQATERLKILASLSGSGPSD